MKQKIFSVPSVVLTAGLFCAAMFGLTTAALAEGENKPTAERVQKGKVLYNSRCRFCHSPRDGDNRLGPHLFNVVGRVSGTVKGYGYSSSTKNIELPWTLENLDRFILDPESVIRGNTMRPYNGIDDPEQRTAIIAYLQTLTK